MSENEPKDMPLTPINWVLVHGTPRCGTSFMTRLVGRACHRFAGDWGLRNLLKEVTENSNAKLDVSKLLTDISNNLLANAKPTIGNQFDLVFKQPILFNDEYRILRRMWGKPAQTIYCFRAPDEYIHSALLKFTNSKEARLQKVYENQLQRLNDIGGRCFEYHGGLTIEDYLTFLEPISIERQGLESFMHKGIKNSSKVTPKMWKVYEKLKELSISQS